MVAEPCSPGSGESGELAVGALGGVRARYRSFYNTLTFNHLVRHSLLATAKVPALKRAVDAAGEDLPNKRAMVWHDGEKFLQQPDLYRKHGLTLVRFPPNSGDLNPIETVWAWLRRDLALREQEDFSANRVITKVQFRQRAAQILKSYEEMEPGQQWSRLQKLVRGMPARLARCKARRYGRCGK